MDRQQTSLRAPEPGRTGACAHEVVAGRLEVVRGDYIALVPDAIIVARRAREWLLTRKATRRYLAVVKARFSREHGIADAAERERLQGVVVANLQRQMATEAAAAANTPRDYKAEIASQRGQLVAVERLCVMLGLDAPRRFEHTTTNVVAAMTPAERRERALRALRRQLDAMPTPLAEGERQ